MTCVVKLGSLLAEESWAAAAGRLPALENWYSTWYILRSLLLFAHPPASSWVFTALALMPSVSIISGMGLGPQGICR